MQDKKTLRRLLLAERAAYTTEEITVMSNKISANLQQMQQIRSAKSIMGYLAFGKELSLDDFMEQALLNKQEVCVPYVLDKTAAVIAASRLMSMRDFNLGAYGIREPEPLHPYPLERLEIVLVPGVGFDVQGRRMGMGKGYYDRFLPKLNALRIGIAMEGNLLEQIPADSYDAVMDYIVTPTGIIKIGREL